MEHVTKIMPALWNVLGRNKKCSINVTTKENEILISILSGKKWKRFKDHNPDNLIALLNAI
jgi:hypothetical protein